MVAAGVVWDGLGVAAQAAAYHNGLDPDKVVPGSVAPAPPQPLVQYEETQDPPSRGMAYFHLLTHQAAIYMTFVCVSLVIAFAIVYIDTSAFRTNVNNNVAPYTTCSDINNAVLVCARRTLHRTVPDAACTRSHHTHTTRATGG